MGEVRSALIRAPMAVAFQRAPVEYRSDNHVLFDPEKPRKSAEDIAREMGGRLTDPYAVNHNCPFCNRTLAWDLFRAHMQPCMRRWFNTVDITHRRFAGASTEETNG